MSVLFLALIMHKVILYTLNTVNLTPQPYLTSLSPPLPHFWELYNKKIVSKIIHVCSYGIWYADMVRLSYEINF